MLLDDVPQYSLPIYEQHLIKLPACVIPWSPSTLGPELILYLVEYNQSMSVTHYMDLRLGFLSCIIHFQWYFHVCMHWNIPKVNILFFPGSLKKGSNYVHSVKLMKVNGSVLSINISPSLVHLAVGSDQGYVSFFSFLSFSMALFLVYLQVQRKTLGHGVVRDWTWTIIDSAMLEKCDSRDRIWATNWGLNCHVNVQVSVFDIEGPTLLYQEHIASEISTGIISLQFDTCFLHGFEKNILVVATKDSSVLALDADTGNLLSSSSVHPKKPYRALFMQILGRYWFLQGFLLFGEWTVQWTLGD